MRITGAEERLRAGNCGMVNTEEVYLFNNMADPQSRENATNIHGLFGAVIVEVPEAKWYRNFIRKKTVLRFMLIYGGNNSVTRFPESSPCSLLYEKRYRDAYAIPGFLQ